MCSERHNVLNKSRKNKCIKPLKPFYALGCTKYSYSCFAGPLHRLTIAFIIQYTYLIFLCML